MSETKTISCKYSFQRLLANHNIHHSNEESNMIDWVGQAMRFIGKHAGFTVKICTNVYVDNYHTCYPLGTEGIIAIMYKNQLLPLGSDLSGIGYERKLDKTSDNLNIMQQETVLEINGLLEQQKGLVEMYAVTPTDELASKIEYVSGRINALEVYSSTLNIYQVGRGSLNYTSGEFWNSKLDLIQTSFERGYIDIVYTSLPIDNDGYPLLIDNEYYIQAIEWYIILMLIQKGYSHPIFDWKTAYAMFWGNPQLGESGWKAKAANNVRIPSLQDAERFTRMWEQFKTRRDLPIQLFNRTEQAFGQIY